jgi:stalled ribosome rescue protein Dom34
MTAQKKIGIWMDHSTANLIEYTHDPANTKVITSDFTHHVKEEALSKGEHLMHNKEQHQQAEFYKKLGGVIKNYDKVVLFGPTNAKDELYNLLSSDHHFENIKIEVHQADKMTENQQHAFVKTYFMHH